MKMRLGDKKETGRRGDKELGKDPEHSHFRFLSAVFLSDWRFEWWCTLADRVKYQDTDEHR